MLPLTMDGHRTAERRSLAYHREVARRLEAHPELLEAARAHLERVPSHWRAAWTALLAGPLATLTSRLVEDSEQMRDLRQTTPFTGILTPAERWAIWRATS